MEKLHNAMRAQAARQAQMIADSRMGIVTSYDPKRYACKVQIMPEGAFPGEGDTGESGWIPIQTIWAGPGWGIYCPPSPGDQVFVTHAEGDPGAGQIIGIVFDADHLPLAVNSGEFWMVHASGSCIKLTNDGDLAVNAQRDCVVTAAGDITATSTGGNIITASIINLKGGGGTDRGIVQGNCLCAFTGAPHPQISATVTGTL